MHLPEDPLTAEQHAALVECLRIFAARGRAIREKRERATQSQSAQDTPQTSECAVQTPEVNDDKN